jgi:hypothetical protein
VQTAPACATKYEAETMREDEDQFRYYVPLLRRIIILVAVITAIPVMLWTITAFVRTYVAPPKLPAFRQMTATASTTAPPIPDSSGKLGAVPQAAAPAQSPPPMVEARATATDARDALPAAKGALLAEPPADASPGALPPKVADLTAAAAAAPADAAPKADTMTPMTFDTPQNNTAVAAQQPAASTDAAADALPAAAPLSGPVPLPRRRPRDLAMAQLSVPMPRPRPGASESDTTATPLEWIRSIFQQPASQEQQSEQQQH